MARKATQSVLALVVFLLFAVSLFLAVPAFSAIEVNLTYPENNTWTNLGNSSLNFTFNHTSEYDGAACFLYLNDTLVGSANATNGTEANISSGAAFSLGANSWKVGCVNSTSEANSTARVLNYDDVAPVPSVVSPVDNYNTSSVNVTFVLYAADTLNLSRIALWGNFTGSWLANSTNNSFVNGTNWTVNVSGFSEGRYVWGVFANDSAGNENFSAANRTLTIDLTAPSVTPAFANATTHRNTTTPTFRFYLSDALTSPSACKLKINNGTANLSEA
ncbi:MAG: hypothetical protein V1820_04120, partial [archaeon]